MYLFRHKIIDNIIIFLLIMSTGGLLFVFNRNLLSMSFCIFLVVVIFFSYNIKRNLTSASLMTLGSFLLLGLINYFFAITEQAINKYLFHLVTVVITTLVLFHFLNNRSNKVFLDRLYFVLKLIAFHSLFNFLFFFLVKNNLTTITAAYHECQTFQYLFFYTTEKSLIEVLGVEFCRNQGLFWEPGILQSFLNILFFLEAFVFKRNKKILLLVIFLILTTYSTTGIALLLLQLFAYSYNQFRTSKLIPILALIFVIPIYLVFKGNIYEKMKGENEYSFQKRLFDLTQPVFIAMENPLTGVGLDLLQFQKVRKEFYISDNALSQVNAFFGTEVKVEISDKGSSNSIMFLLAAVGFPTTIILLYMFINQQLIPYKKWLLMVILIISVMSSPLLLRPFFFIFICSGFIHIFYKITSHQYKLS